MWKCPGNRTILTSSDSTISCFDTRSPLQPHLLLRLPWSGSNSLVSHSVIFGIAFRRVDAVPKNLTSRSERQSSCTSRFFFSRDFERPPMRTWTLFLSARATVSSAWGTIIFSIGMRDTGVFAVNLADTDHNLIHRGVGRRCTVRKTVTKVEAGLGNGRSEASMGWLAPDFSKKRNVIASFEGSLFGCLGLRAGDVDVKGGHCW